MTEARASTVYFSPGLDTTPAQVGADGPHHASPIGRQTEAKGGRGSSSPMTNCLYLRGRGRSTSGSGLWLRPVAALVGSREVLHICGRVFNAKARGRKDAEKSCKPFR